MQNKTSVLYNTIITYYNTATHDYNTAGLIGFYYLFLHLIAPSSCMFFFLYSFLSLPSLKTLKALDPFPLKEQRPPLSPIMWPAGLQCKMLNSGCLVSLFMLIILMSKKDTDLLVKTIISTFLKEDLHQNWF